jgi:transposase
MRQVARVTVTMRELDRLKSIQAVVDGELKPMLAAERLGLTSRQVRRLAALYRQCGPVGLLSKRRNQRSNRRLSSKLEEQVVQILREHYADFGPTLAREKLEARHGIMACFTASAIRSALSSFGLVSPPVSESLAFDALHRQRRALRIADPELGASVAAEFEFGQVAVEVLFATLTGYTSALPR